MVGLGVMARLLSALRPRRAARPRRGPQQLASVEVGAVLADLVAPATSSPGTAPHGVARLTRTHRYAAGGGIAAIAQAVREARSADVVDLLRAGGPRRGVPRGPRHRARRRCALEVVRADVVVRSRAVVEAARAGDAATALTALDTHRLLCAHRRGTRGVAHWSALAQRWAVEELGVLPRPDGRYVGLPVIVTANDAAVGVSTATPGWSWRRTGCSSPRSPAGPDRCGCRWPGWRPSSPCTR